MRKPESYVLMASQDMWVEIFQSNQRHVVGALDEFVAEIEELRSYLVNENWDDIYAYLDGARGKRREWYAQWMARRESRR